jgi:hypothetical protein
MSDEEIIKMYDEMIELWSDKLPNFEHEPIRFAYYVKMYRYLKEQNNDNR